jgi:hypothetical protein
MNLDELTFDEASKQALAIAGISEDLLASLPDGAFRVVRVSVEISGVVFGAEAELTVFEGTGTSAPQYHYRGSRPTFEPFLRMEASSHYAARCCAHRRHLRKLHDGAPSCCGGPDDRRQIFRPLIGRD